MLKWFGPSNGPASQSRSKYVGKTYHVGDHRVTVEEVIAEGEPRREEGGGRVRGRRSVGGREMRGGGGREDEALNLSISYTGGFATVFQVRTSHGQRYALKRVAVNSETDLFLCKQEIAITVGERELVCLTASLQYSVFSLLQQALSDCKHSVTFIASAINRLSGDVHEVLILLQQYTGETITPCTPSLHQMSSHLTL